MASSLTIFCKIRRQAVEPLLADHGNRADVGLAGRRDVFRGIDEMQRRVLRYGGQRTVDGALLQSRQNVGERHRHRRPTHPLDQFQLKRRRQHPDFQTRKVAQRTDLFLGQNPRRTDRENSAADRPLLAPNPKIRSVIAGS
jgi:hypothetical protein